MTRRTSTFQVCRASRLVPLLLLFAATASSEPYGVGEQLTSIALPDQHDVEQHIDATVKVILFSRNMDADKIVKKALKDVEPGTLEALDAVYVANIEGMPELVSKLFALPAMRRRPYSMLLDRDGLATARFPQDGTRVTLIRCNDLEVTHVLFLDEPADLHRELGLAPK